MQRFSIHELTDRLNIFGRSFHDSREDILWFNWSADTVEFSFRGTHLNLSFCAACGYEFEGPPGDPNAPRRPTWPCVAVFLDDMDSPIRRFQIASENETWLVYQSLKPETHRIRVTKLTENSKSFLGLTAFTAEGEFLPTGRPQRRRIEIVGDSITCGYGNRINDAARHFYEQDEDAWMAYGPLAARELGMEFSCVSISGITGVRHAGWMMPYAMSELYAYTDRLGQERLGLEAAPWDFAAQPNDCVLVNLGTNDCYATLFTEDSDDLTKFQGAYADFIREIRRLNGEKTHIVCALGSMNYYLYSDIAAAVETLRAETGDRRLHLLRFRPMHPMDGVGADGHPYLTTHKKMAQELAELLRTLED